MVTGSETPSYSTTRAVRPIASASASNSANVFPTDDSSGVTSATVSVGAEVAGGADTGGNVEGAGSVTGGGTVPTGTLTRNSSVTAGTVYWPPSSPMKR